MARFKFPSTTESRELESQKIEVFMKADRRLYLTPDGQLVDDTDPTSPKILWARKGKEISAEDAKKYGLTEKGGKVQLKGEAKSESKMLEPAEDKMKAKTEDKAKPRTRRR